VGGIPGAGVTVQHILDFVGADRNSPRVNALAANTWKQYCSGLKRWLAFAEEEGADALRPNVQTLEACIRYYYDKGVSPAALDLMTTSVSTVFSWKTNERLGKMDPIISLIRGIQRGSRSLKKEKRYFDPELILSRIEEIEWREEGLEEKLMKLATLLILCYAVRFTEMESIRKREIIVEARGTGVSFVITKKSNQGERVRIRMKAIRERQGVCLVKATQEVLERNAIRSDALFAIRDKNEKVVALSASKIAKLVRRMMALAGIDESIGPYNCKHSALTKAWANGAEEDEIVDAARWAPGSKMLHKHYKVLSASENVSRIIVSYPLV
jgi:site-specific recombinase XerD